MLEIQLKPVNYVLADPVMVDILFPRHRILISGYWL